MVSLRWVDPPTTAFMAANPNGALQQSVPIEHVSRNFLAAVIAHEDAPLPYRSGAFTWAELAMRAQAHLAGDEDPSGSTIPQQVAKRSEEHTSELQSRQYLVCRLLLEKK